jgi:hypothetical protein
MTLDHQPAEFVVLGLAVLVLIFAGSLLAVAPLFIYPAEESVRRKAAA